MPAKKKKSFNLAQLDTYTKSVSGVEIQIEHPIDGGPIGDKGKYLVIKVLGPESPQYKKAQTQMMRNLMRSHDGDKKVQSLSQIADSDYEADAFEMICDCVAGWSNMFFDPEGGDDMDDKNPLKYTEANKRMILTHCPWIRVQLQNFIADQRNFLRG